MEPCSIERLRLVIIGLLPHSPAPPTFHDPKSTPEPDASAVHSEYPSIEHLLERARVRVPRFAFEYLEGGCIFVM